MSDLVIPPEQFRPVIPGITSDTTNRSVDLYRKVCAQFGVSTNIRYKVVLDASGNIADTWCNIFAEDCTLAMGAPIPHWIDTIASGVPVAMGKGVELTADKTCDWLVRPGFRYGWTQCCLEDARTNANAGCPTVTTWKNPTGRSGHIAMVMPDDLTIDPGPIISQAGKTNFDLGPLVRGFGNLPTKFWLHQ